MELEIESIEYTIEEAKQQKTSPKTLNNAGELVFRRLESQTALFYQNKFCPLPIHQRKTNTHFIVINTDRLYKTFQINENHQIEFKSSHIIEFPIFSKGYCRAFSEDHLHYFFKKKAVEKRKSAINFFKENSIAWDTPSWLGFGLRIGTGQPERTPANFYGETRYQESDREEMKVRDFFDNQKPLLNSGICLYLGKSQEKIYHDQGGQERGQVYFLSRFHKKYSDLVKHLFEFHLKPERLFGYEKKVVEDFEKISPKFSNICNFFEHCQSFIIENDEPGTAKKLMPFTQVDNYMIIVGLVDIRKRVIPIKRLVSMYELLSLLEFNYPPAVTFFNILVIDYSAELDVLILDTWINFVFEADDLDKIDSVISNRGEGDELSGIWEF